MPPATPATSSAGSRSVAKSAPACTRVSSSTEIARSDWPATSRRRTPTSATSFPPVIAAATNDAAVVASHAKPVRVGDRAVSHTDARECTLGTGDAAGCHRRGGNEDGRISLAEWEVTRR